MAASQPERRPRIAYNYVDALKERLAAHWSKPVMLDYPGDRPPWEVPEDADLLICFHTGWENAPKVAPAGWPHNLKQIHVLTAGVDKYPDWFFKGTVMTCGRGVSAAGIAEYALTAVSAREKCFIELANPALRGQKPAMRGIAGKKLGLLGIGAIGQAIASRAAAFGMDVLACSRSGRKPDGFDITMIGSLPALMAQADHVIVTLPLTGETHLMLDKAAFDAAKPGLHLVNVSRGLIVDQEALLEALDSGKVGFATLDVTEPEPLPPDHRLLSHPNVLVTPHISWMAEDNFERLVAKALRDLDRYVRGEPPLDVVDPAAGY